MRNTFLFDLDGTLLPINTDEFLLKYFNELGQHFHGIIDSRLLTKYIMESTQAMIDSIEPISNEEVFMKNFSKLIEEDNIDEYKDRFDIFYEESFDRVRGYVEEQPLVKKSIKLLKDKGYKLVIATNPLFPIKAIHKRIEWAGLDVDDFAYISCYQKNTYCKPNIQFYEEILETIGKEGHECYMVGNDVQEDLITGEIGMETYLITDHIINRDDQEIDATYQGSYEDFYEFVKGLKPVN